MTTAYLSLFQQLSDAMNQQLVGQTALVERLMIALLADGHLLVEGPPGVAKTRAIKLLSQGIEGDYHRIQFTPDLLPADLTGSDIYHHQTSQFTFQAGPIFHHLLLADEINRAPAKVQSALLEAMAEKQVTIGQQVHTLPRLFLVMATQNPIENEGTYALPEAQLDRFMLHVKVDYPEKAHEESILALARNEFSAAPAMIPKLIAQEDLFSAQQLAMQTTIVTTVTTYLIELIAATRHPGAYNQDLKQWITWGASPRATIALDRGCRAYAWLKGQDYVCPELVQALLPDILRHRLVISYEAQAEGITVDEVIAHLIQQIPVP